MLIDIALAGDNAVVVGLAVAGLPARQRRPAIMLGHRRRDGRSASASARSRCDLLAIIGLLLAGGLLLLWVCWKMFRELRRPDRSPRATAAAARRRRWRRRCCRSSWPTCR